MEPAVEISRKVGDRLGAKGAAPADPGRHGVHETARIIRPDADLHRHIDPAFPVEPEGVLDDGDRLGERRRGGFHRILIEEQKFETVLRHCPTPLSIRGRGCRRAL